MKGDKCLSNFFEVISRIYSNYCVFASINNTISRPEIGKRFFLATFSYRFKQSFISSG